MKPNIITHNKTQTDIQEDQSRELLKKAMIQQTLLQNYAYIRKDRVHWANRLLTVNGAKDTDISKQIIYNLQFKDKRGCPVDRS